MSYNHLGALLYPEDINLSTGDHIQNTLLSAPNSAFIPMCFWFCRNPGLAIPLIALQYHEVKFNINFANIDSFAYAGFTGATQRTPNVDFSSFKVYADYVYLDTTERRQFAQNAHEYLIDQLQLQSGENDSTIRLNFNHPVKELIFTGTPKKLNHALYQKYIDHNTPGETMDIQKDYIDNGNDYHINEGISISFFHMFGGGSPDALSIGTIKLVLNGTDRFTERPLEYFTQAQIWEHHTGYGKCFNNKQIAITSGDSIYLPTNRLSNGYDTIGVYSFALRPEEHQPSGTCNFSRIDNAQLVLDKAPPGAYDENVTPIDIYAVNYNVLRIMSGMGGLAYSN
jgi:hypothetical protein